MAHRLFPAGHGPPVFVAAEHFELEELQLICDEAHVAERMVEVISAFENMQISRSASLGG